MILMGIYLGIYRLNNCSMASLFQNKYRNESTRLQHWDYGWDGAYFITICTKDREHFFGNISNGKMELSGIGLIANDYWLQIPDHAKNVELGVLLLCPTMCMESSFYREIIAIRNLQSVNNDFKTREKTQFHPSLVDTNPLYPNRHTSLDFISDGNRVFMIISSVTINHFKISHNTSSTIL